MALCIQAGTIQINAQQPTTNVQNPSGFTRVDFPTPFSAVPIVTAMVQSFHGPDTPGLRIRDVSETGFDIRMNELVLNGTALEPAGGHVRETVSWIAVLT